MDFFFMSLRSRAVKSKRSWVFIHATYFQSEFVPLVRAAAYLEVRPVCLALLQRVG